MNEGEALRYFFWCDVVRSRVCFYLDAYHSPLRSAYHSRIIGLGNGVETNKCLKSTSRK